MIDFFFDGSGGEQAVDGDLLGLPDAPRPLPGLRVRGGIPVGVVYDDPVRPRQIHP